MNKQQSLYLAKQKVLRRIAAECVVYKRSSGEALVITKKLEEELHVDYGVNHKPYVQQLLDIGWVPTNNNPIDYVDVRCWWGSEGSGYRRRPVIKHDTTHHLRSKRERSTAPS